MVPIKGWQLKRHLTIAILLGIASIELFYKLGSSPLYFDEAIYAEVSKGILRRGDWVTSHWNGMEWFEKPPLFIWATAIAFKLFGVGEFWARSISGLCGVGVVVVSYAGAKNLYNRTAGLVAGIILLASPLFVFFSRFGSTDICLTFFLTLGLYFYLRSQKDSRFWPLVGLAFGCAALVKGAPAIVGPFSVLAGLITEQRVGRTIQGVQFWLGVAVALLIAASWHIGQYVAHGSEFLNAYFGLHILGRSSRDVFGGNYGYVFYFVVLWQGFFPWVGIAPVAIVFERNRQAVSLIAMAVITLILYSLSATKFAWYILPGLPPLAILTGGFLAARVQKKLTLGLLVLLTAFGFLKSVRSLALPPHVNPTAKLSKIAARDTGEIMTAPEELQGTVIYYSERRVCTDPVLNHLSYGFIKPCDSSEARHIIFSAANRGLVESRLNVRIVAEDSGMYYAEIVP